MPMQRSVAACALAALLAACASHSRPAELRAPEGEAAAAGGGGGEGVITQDEIEALHVSTAFQAVQKLRAEYLNVRGPSSVEDPAAALPTVYVDGIAFGNVASLRLIPAMDVAQIRFLGAWDAATEYGGRHRGGVIAVTTRRH
ncbi:MAG TPA: hypothetical protein VFS05_16040 [Gemmatimonadaceae bacterium]|nr:hypothetical protein [Gemmatimonadaceae bacterium]